MTANKVPVAAPAIASKAFRRHPDNSVRIYRTVAHTPAMIARHRSMVIAP
jgi:hypothetical protein